MCLFSKAPSEVFGPKSKPEDVIALLNQLAMTGEYVYRGYCKTEELYPQIIRKKDNCDKENQLLLMFEQYGSNCYNANSTFDFLSYAQHFGLPTRLLDFTHNPLIALTFALYTDKNDIISDVKDDHEYYYIRYASTKKNLTLPYLITHPNRTKDRLVQKEEIESYAARAASYFSTLSDIMYRPNSDYSMSIIKEEGLKAPEETVLQRFFEEHTILFIDPNLSNQRIFMQQGLYMLPYTLNKNEHMNILEKNSKLIKIHKNLREPLVTYLNAVGFNTLRLMPDLSNICNTIKKQVLTD